MHRGFDQLLVNTTSIEVFNDTISTFGQVGFQISPNAFQVRPFLARFDTSGVIIDSFFTSSLNTFVSPNKAIFMENGQMISTGVFSTDSLGNPSNTGTYLQKSTHGQEDWFVRYQDSLPYIDYYINDIIRTPSGQIGMIGYLGLEGDSILPGFPDSDILFILSDSNGSILHFKRIGNNNAQENGIDIKLGNHNTFIISCIYNFPSGPDFKRLMITDFQGIIIKDYYVQGLLITDAIQSQDGGYVFSSYITDAFGLIGTLNKLDSNMSLQWSTTIHPIGSSHNALKKIIEDSTGNFYLMGNATGILFDQDTAGRNGFICKVSKNGDSIWSRQYGIIDYSTLFDRHYFNDFTLINNKLYIAGNINNPLGPLEPAQQLWLVSVDTNGCPHPDCVVGIDEPSDLNQDICVIPNPNKGEFKFRFKEGMIKPQELRIYDSNGIEIFYDQNLDFSNEINLNGIKNGIYFYTIQGVKDVRRGKLVIRK